MIQYLLPAKVKKQTSDPSDGEANKRRGRASRAAHKIWVMYMGHPRKVVRIIVFFACSIAVLFQLAQCFRKLTNPPISTRSRVMLNATMFYPAITVCRSPSYKTAVLEKYGLGKNIRWTSEWKNFPFENATLSEFWEEATFTAKEVIVIYGLNRKPTNVDIRSDLYYLAGKCHTIVPLVDTSTAGLGVGYSLFLMHTNPNEEDSGWEIFVHEPNEPWTETGMQRSGSSEGVWLEVEEELHLKITAQHIKTISQKNNRCENDVMYSVNMCQRICRWAKLASIAGCTAPWMASIINTTVGKKYKECDNYHDTRELVVEYLRQGGLSSSFIATNIMENDTHTDGDAYGCEASCLRPCQITQYTTFVVNRKSISNGRDKRSLGAEKFLEVDNEGSPQYKREANAKSFVSGGEYSPLSDSNDSFPIGDTNWTDPSVDNSIYYNPCNDAEANDSIDVPRRIGCDYTMEKREDVSGKEAYLKKMSEYQETSFSKLNVFYTSKMVSVMEENWGYDFSQFVADAGGSLGFLLGMSVVGAVALLEQLAEALVASVSRCEESSEDRENKEKGADIKAEDGTVVPYHEIINKY